MVVDANKLIEKQADSTDIWNAEEVNDGAEYDDVYDAREVPELVTVSKFSSS